VSIAEQVGFDFVALHATVDARRQAEGLSWERLANETRPAGAAA